MISILIPFRNEIESFRNYDTTFFPIVDTIMDGCDQEYEYIFIDDGSFDDSGSMLYTMFVISRVGDSKSLKKFDIIDNPYNHGLGNALRFGFTKCNGDYIIVMDADLSYKPRDILRMLIELKNNPQLKCISASPYCYGFNSKIVGSSPLRIFGSIMFNSIYTFLLREKFTCATGMFRLYHTKTLQKFNLKSTGFDINSEIIVEFLLRKEQFLEIPSMLHIREVGKSKMNIITEVLKEFKLIGKIIYKLLFIRY